MNRIIIISYSYPPDNAPAAHRPYEFAKFLEESNVPFIVYSKYGSQKVSNIERSPGNKTTKLRGGKKNSFLLKMIKVFSFLMEIDKALPWGLKSLPRIIFSVIIFRIQDKEPPIIWVTSPGMTNAYVGLLVSLLSFSKLHVDVRDAGVGIDSESSVPLLTRFLYHRAKTVTAVTSTLSKMVKTQTNLKPEVITVFNGTSNESINTLDINGSIDTQINFSYAGALYGGDRPVGELLRLLNTVADRFADHNREVHLNIIGREDLSHLDDFVTSDNLYLNIKGELAKNEALEFSAFNDINVVLIGKEAMHKCGIPLKVFDLLGVGRPILLIGPRSSDAVELLAKTENLMWCNIDTESHDLNNEIKGVGIDKWILDAHTKNTIKNTDYLASESSRQIYNIITS